MNKYNLDKLIKVSCYDFEESKWYDFKKEIKFLFFVIRKEGIYQYPFDHYLSRKVPQNHILRNGIIYKKPMVVLYYENDFSKVYYFDSFNEAKLFYNEITSVGRWKS